MYLCVCESVTSKEWEEALVTCGNNLEEASLMTGAGQNCGSCWNILSEVALRKSLEIPLLQVA